MNRAPEAALSLPPLALYVHLPWCARKCPYCDFNSHALSGALPERDYVEAAQVLGGGAITVLGRHILPHPLPVAGALSSIEGKYSRLFTYELTDLAEVVVNAAYHLCHEDLRAVQKLAQRRIGALIVLERETQLDDQIEAGALAGGLTGSSGTGSAWRSASASSVRASRISRSNSTSE